MASGLNIAAELGKMNGFATMPGPERAAALLLLLGEQEGAPIWQMLDEDEVKKVSHAMVQLGSLEAATVAKLISCPGYRPAAASPRTSSARNPCSSRSSRPSRSPRSWRRSRARAASASGRA